MCRHTSIKQFSNELENLPVVSVFQQGREPAEYKDMRSSDDVIHMLYDARTLDTQGQVLLRRQVIFLNKIF